MKATTLVRPVDFEVVEATTQDATSAAAGTKLESIGKSTIRVGLVVVIAWIGLMKFTSYEANAIAGLVQNSPLLRWVYGVFSIEGFGRLLDTSEIFIAGAIALRPLAVLEQRSA